METFRQILSTEISQSQKATLRSFFNVENGKTYSKITQIKHFMGYDNADDAYERLRQLYNPYVLEKQRQRKNEKARALRSEKKINSVILSNEPAASAAVVPAASDFVSEFTLPMFST